MWEEEYRNVNLATVRNMIRRLAGGFGLFDRGHTVDSLMLDVLWLSWVRFEQYRPDDASFETWLIWLVRSELDRLRRNAMRTTPFSQLDLDELEVVEVAEHPGPTPEQCIIRAEEIASAEETMVKLRILVGMYKGRTRHETDLAVIETYLHLIRQRPDGGRVTQTEVAQVLGLTPQGVQFSLRRIACACKSIGLRV